MIITKQQKNALKAALDVKATTDKIISVRETANELGIKQIDRQQCAGLAQSFCRLHPEYKAVQMMNTPTDSLFCSLTFVDKELEFDDGTEETYK